MREKEARGHALTAKLAQRKLEEAKASAAKAVAGVNTRVAEAVAAAEARHKAQEDARVHLMLCIIREPVEAARQAQGKPQPASQPEASCSQAAAAAQLARHLMSCMGFCKAALSYLCTTCTHRTSVRVCCSQR